MSDALDDILATVRDAMARNETLSIRGGDSKSDLLGRASAGRALHVAKHTGIVDYHPGELYLTARAGTSLADIAATLAAEEQELACESPLFDGQATLGGSLACNLSGPGRPWRGSIRDLALGVQLINGRGELLRFGGKVVKNVAGYDVTRLQAGALGTLGVLTEVTLKVLPRPEHSLTLAFELDAAAALHKINQLAGQPKPLCGACWIEGRLYLRLAGAASAVSHTAELWGGETSPGADRVWEDLREMRLPFFNGSETLWRYSGSSSVPVSEAFGPGLIDWGGAQRWFRGDLDQDALAGWARQGRGHITRYRASDQQGMDGNCVNAMQRAIQQRLKQAFDPQGLFNPNHLYSAG